jgi:ABC-type phosphate transport system ATPase subunit
VATLCSFFYLEAEVFVHSTTAVPLSFQIFFVSSQKRDKKGFSLPSGLNQKFCISKDYFINKKVLDSHQQTKHVDPILTKQYQNQHSF